MSSEKIYAHWRRKQVQKVRRRAKNRSFRFRLLRGNGLPKFSFEPTREIMPQKG